MVCNFNCKFCKNNHFFTKAKKWCLYERYWQIYTLVFIHCTFQNFMVKGLVQYTNGFLHEVSMSKSVVGMGLY